MKLHKLLPGNIFYLMHKPFCILLIGKKNYPVSSFHAGYQAPSDLVNDM
jgi:hypothetical protein